MAAMFQKDILAIALLVVRKLIAANMTKKTVPRRVDGAMQDPINS